MKTMKIIITEQDKQMHDIHYICQGDAFSKTKKKTETAQYNNGKNRGRAGHMKRDPLGDSLSLSYPWIWAYSRGRCNP